MKKISEHPLFPASVIAAMKLALHLATASGYAFGADELYFIDCSRRLDFGYVDLMPLTPFLLAVERWVFGTSLVATRVFPALAGVASVVLAGMIAREMGGKRFAAAVAALAVAVAPAMLRVGGTATIAAFEPALWTACAYLTVRILNGGPHRLWTGLGLALGLGTLNKLSILLLGGGLVTGFALSGTARKHFASRWLWLGAAVTAVMLAPFIAWQARHDWITLEFIRTLGRTAGQDIGVLEFFLGQVLYLNPLNAPIWIGGVIFLLVGAPVSRFRPLGWAYLVVVSSLLISVRKIYYLIPIYPMLFAASAVWLEGLVRGAAPRACLTAALAFGGILTLPAALPVLSSQLGDRYVGAITLGLINPERAPELMFGDVSGKRRDQMLADVASAYRAITQDSRFQRLDVAVLAATYAEASAINLLGPRYGLPGAISGHVNYHLWGPGSFTGETVLAVGYDTEYLHRFFRTVTEIPTSSGVPISISRNPLKPLAELWPELRSFGY